MKIRSILGAAALSLLLAACGTSQSATTTPEAGKAAESADTVLKVGASAVPHAEILKFVKDNLAPAAGLKLEIVEFSDYVQPNVQLDEGQLQANFFQHKPYLDDFNASKGTKLSFVTP
ncbi:MAG: metal ABC transporter substrate-binding protein, partial [Nonomuraea sp.]|nr:metal ABC transporter substrate-binding protein [Nonomuraea sp.]